MSLNHSLPRPLSPASSCRIYPLCGGPLSHLFLDDREYTTLQPPSYFCARLCSLLCSTKIYSSILTQLLANLLACISPQRELQVVCCQLRVFADLQAWDGVCSHPMGDPIKRHHQELLPPICSVLPQLS